MFEVLVDVYLNITCVELHAESLSQTGNIFSDKYFLNENIG